ENPSTKLESNRHSESSNHETSSACNQPAIRGFEFGFSNFRFVSDFEFRASDFSPHPSTLTHSCPPQPPQPSGELTDSRQGLSGVKPHSPHPRMQERKSTASPGVFSSIMSH